MTLRRYRRLRWVQWGLVGAFAVIAVVWASSGYFSLYRMGGRTRFAITLGYIWFGRHPWRNDSLAIWEGWSAARLSEEYRWRYGGWMPSWSVDAQRRFSKVEVPLWLVAAPFGAGAIGVGVVRRRARERVAAGNCMACGYDRQGLAAGVACPECGKP